MNKQASAQELFDKIASEAFEYGYQQKMEALTKEAVSAEYVAQMMYKSPKHSKEVYDIATKAIKGTRNTVLPKHPLVEKKLTAAFRQAASELDGIVYPKPKLTLALNKAKGV